MRRNERYYSKDGKTYATIFGTLENGKIAFCVYYYPYEYGIYEEHKVKSYEWTKHLHGNAPSGTPCGSFKASKNGKRIILTV